MRDKSEKYFGFWVEFINEVHKSLPKIQKPTPPKTGAAAKKVDPKAAQREA